MSLQLNITNCKCMSADEHPPPGFVDVVPRQSLMVPWHSDIYMKPAMQDDLLLLFDVEDGAFPADAQPLQQTSSPDEEEITLKASHLQQLMHDLKTAQDRADHAQEQARSLAEALKTMKAGVHKFMTEPAEPTTSCGAAGAAPVNAIKRLTVEEDEAYFSSYADYGIHGDMLKDRVRTESYRDCMYKNPEVFRGKVVLDVGCGTGILSMFAARAGASQVFAVDQAEIIYQAMGIIRENNLEDKITFIKGRLEDVTLPVEKVDIIMSEWMGYFLLFESMLDTVVVARDQFLAPGGKVYPDKCSVWLVGVADSELWQQAVGFWDDVYGFSMSCMKSGAVEDAHVEVVQADKVITEPCKVKDLDLNTCQLTDLEFTSNFTLRCCGDGELTSIVGYFNIGFEAGCSRQVHFSTSPSDPPTHWKQTVFHLETPIAVSDGMTIDGRIQVKKVIGDPRSLQVKIRVGLRSQMYQMR
ncbi:hypothetical protein BaRGS_00005574 [Batillaria attramentaria]|uniref:type I protein arginine methyltransferase n=1 Tax=Batillaria attramentaria TaxID=370345 RepID=A0ABD0LUP1_9CAEN